MIPIITGDMLRQEEFREPMRRLLLGTAEKAPTASINGNKTHDGAGAGANDANFDTNMVIILAALLCALICALGLNSIVRCALRCGRRIAFETPEETAARLAGTGLKKRALRQIPVAVYGPEAGILATDCPICLGEFADGEKVRVLPKCNHGFHVRCIDTWLGSHSSCPTCRQSLLDRTMVEEPPETGGDAPVPVPSAEAYVVVDVRSSS